MKEVKDYLAKYEALLDLKGSISYADAEKRAASFLAAMATLTNLRHTFSEEKIKLTSVQTATYAEQMAGGSAKTVTENKLMAEASPEYTKAREELERIENDISFLKAYCDIFQNAHIFYRNMAKGDNS